MLKNGVERKTEAEGREEQDMQINMGMKRKKRGKKK